MSFEKNSFLPNEVTVENGLGPKPSERNGLIKALVKWCLMGIIAITCLSFVARQGFSISFGTPLTTKSSGVKVVVNQGSLSPGNSKTIDDVGQVTLVNAAIDSQYLNVTLTFNGHVGEGQVKLVDPPFFDEPWDFPAYFKFAPEFVWPWYKVIGKKLSLQVDGVAYNYIKISATHGLPIGGYFVIATGPPEGYKGTPFRGSGGKFTWRY